MGKRSRKWCTRCNSKDHNIRQCFMAIPLPKWLWFS